MLSRLYLDNAATSFPKPEGVIAAMVAYATRCGASPGRGQYAESREGARLIRRCRERLAALMNAERAESMVFALNTTDALNLAIKGVVRGARLAEPGRPLRIVTTAMDHNSVLRPLHALAQEGVEVTHVKADPVTGEVDPAAVGAAVGAGPRPVLCVVNMASNVGGTIQPVGEIVRRCGERGVLTLVDAAQALGHVEVDVRAMGCDMLAFPGHKGLLGPQGTGGLYIRPGVEDRVATTREGGTGSWSELDGHPATMPERYEAGSHNTAGLVGLSEAVAWLLERGVGALRRHEVELMETFLTAMRGMGARHPHWPATGGPCEAFTLLGPVETAKRVAVFAMTHDTLDAHEVAALLDTRFGILARAGITCAPRAHAALGTLERGGAFRVSFGPFVTPSDVARLADALREIARDVPGPIAADRSAIGLAPS